MNVNEERSNDPSDGYRLNYRCGYGDRTLVETFSRRNDLLTLAAAFFGIAALVALQF